MTYSMPALPSRDRTRIAIALSLATAALLVGCASKTSTSAVQKPGVATVASTVSPSPTATTQGTIAATDPPQTNPAPTSPPASSAPPTGPPTTSPAVTSPTTTVATVIAVHDVAGASLNGARPARIEILVLDRGRGDTVHLSYRVSALGSGVNVWSSISTAEHSGWTDAASLVDLTNNLRYNVIRDTDGQCLCTEISSSSDLNKGESLVLDAVFPAPPASVTNIDVQLGSFGVVTDVPIGNGHA